MCVLRAAFSNCGYELPDGKEEIALDRNGKPMLIDVAGNLDENRIIHSATGALRSKDLIRTHPILAAWKKSELDPAKAEYPNDKSKWPPYPLLPEKDIAHFASEFQAVTYDYTGVRVS
jgi:phosphoribosylaminoimidazole-succinocarboxamide synthase